MADSERLGASFSIDVTQLKTGLAQANRLIRESQSEFKAAAAGVDDWTKSEDGLKAKIKSLNEITAVQKTKVEALQTEYDNLVAEGMDPASAAAVDLRTKINNEKAALAKNEAELKKQEAALKELEDASGDAEDGLDDLADAAEDSGDGFTVAKGAMADLVSNGIQALVGAAKNVVSSFMEMSEATQEYREDIGKLQTAFETAGKSSELATQTYKDMYAVLGEEDRSVEAVNHLAKLVSTQEDMTKWTDICAGVWGTFGDSLPIEGLTEAANEVAKTGELTGVLVDALNWATTDQNVWNKALGEGTEQQKAFAKGVKEGMSSEDAFKEALAACNDEQERADLITRTLNGLYSEASDNYKENNKSIMEARRATSDYTDAQAELGAAIEPLTTEFTKLKTKGLQWFVDNGLPFLQKNLPAIATLLGGVTTAIIAQTAATKIKTAIDAAQAAGLTITTAAQQGLNAALKANPIGIVITAVTLLVSAFLLLWRNCEGFRNFFINLWKTARTAATTAVDAIKSAFNALPKFFSGLWSKIKNTFSNLGTKIGDAIGGAVRTAINGVIATIENTINGAVDLINGAIGLINKLPGVHVGNVSRVNFPRLAEGGTVNKATAAIIGEAGPERVIPLKDDAEWIDRVADAFANKTGGGVTVNQTNNYSQAHSRYELYKSKQQTVAAVRLAMGRA